MQREQLPDDKPAHLQNSNAYDQELLVRIQRGDEAALGLLYDRYDRFVYTIALRITGDRVISRRSRPGCVSRGVAIGRQLSTNVPRDCVAHWYHAPPGH